MVSSARGIPVETIRVSTFVVPTDAPESDGTLEWKETTVVVVEASGGGKTGIGFSYASRASAEVIHGELTKEVVGVDLLDVPTCFEKMVTRIRNLGRPGIVGMAISAVDAALWDLKARVLDVALVSLFGREREEIAAYGSGGFTSYSVAKLCDQLGGWVERGIPRVKMKVGREPSQDLSRVRAVRQAIGEGPAIFVDANGAYDRKQALEFAERYAELGVTWFEEPVSSDDLEGLRLLRDRAPGGMHIAAGEYGYDLVYFERMLAAGAVDTLQADMTRCGGYSGFRDVDVLCRARTIALSAHCSPTLHAHVACAARSVIHVEYFHDHARIEQLLFDGALTPRRGFLVPDASRPGNGLTLKRAEANRFAA